MQTRGALDSVADRESAFVYGDVADMGDTLSRIVRSSTGNSDTSDRDFCADLVQFTS